MHLTVHQNITIYNFKVGSVANSSILQIGSSGSIKGLSQIYNTGGFTEPAPPTRKPYELPMPEKPRERISPPLVPLTPYSYGKE